MNGTRERSRCRPAGLALALAALAVVAASVPAASGETAPGVAAPAPRPTVRPLLEATRTVAGEPLAWPCGDREASSTEPDDREASKAERPDAEASKAERPDAEASKAERGGSAAPPAVASQIVTLEPGASTRWHRHAVPTYGHILEGEVEVEYAGLGRRTLKAGDTLLEAMDVPHVGANLGDVPVRILVVTFGPSGATTTMPSTPPDMPPGLGGPREPDLVDLAQADPRLRLDIRYAGERNFTGRAVYPAARAFLHRDAAEALRRVEDKAQALGYGLLVLDAYRPWSVTRLFWDEYPAFRPWLADPLEGSRHNRGCAVDLTLVRLSTGEEVAMPSGYDDFSVRADPEYSGGSEESRANRDLLRRLMEAEGFAVYENEWWHFDFRGWRDYRVLDRAFDEIDAVSQP